MIQSALGLAPAEENQRGAIEPPYGHGLVLAGQVKAGDLIFTVNRSLSGDGPWMWKPVGEHLLGTNVKSYVIARPNEH